jgi:hypothetical protein
MEYNKIYEVLNDISKYNPNNFIIVTGGIGDFLTLDYYYSLVDTKNIIFISKQSLILKTMVTDYKLKNNNYALYFDFRIINKPGFCGKNELIEYFPYFKDINVIDISEYFTLIKNNFNDEFICSSSIFKNININIKKQFKLPKKYALICPYTEDNRINCIDCNFMHSGIQQKCKLTRNFIGEDYVNVFEYLKKNNIVGVIISHVLVTINNKYKNNIINFSNKKLSIPNCIEIAKQSSYYFGIDSFLSVIVTKILDSDKIYIKCNNSHGNQFKDVYWNKTVKLHSIINI